MKIKYWKDVDILSFDWTKNKVDNSREIKSIVLLDFAKDGSIVGLEIMDFMSAMKASQREVDNIFKMARSKKLKGKKPKKRKRK